MPSLILLTAQAVLVWMIVFSSTVPMPQPKKRWAVVIIVASTLAAIAEIIYFHSAGILLTAALAGYGWGSFVSTWVEGRAQERESAILDAE